MNTKIIFASLFFSLLQSPAHSETYETLVKDFHFNSSSKIVIDQETIEKTQAKDVFSLISSQANISFFNQNFQPPQIFLRGADSSHILIIIDGVPTYDTSWNQRTFNLNTLDLKNIRRIEVLKGGQSVIYGGQALAGVIKIDTFASDFSRQKRVEIAAGTQNEKKLSVGFQENLSDSTHVHWSGRLQKRNAPSSVRDSEVNYENTMQNSDVALATSLGDTKFLGRAFYFLDQGGLPTTVSRMGVQTLADTEALSKRDQQYGVSLGVQNSQMLFSPKLTLNTQKGSRIFEQDKSVENPSGVDRFFKSQLVATRLDLTLYDQGSFSTQTGLSYAKEDFYYRDGASTVGDNFSELRGIFLLGKYKGEAERWILEAGVRGDSVDNISSKTSYQLGLSLITRTKLEWSTGFRSASPGQKYGLYGNANLNPETAQTYSITQEYTPFDNATLALTVFETSFNNQIALVTSTFKYENIARSQTRGFELVGSQVLDSSNTVQMTYGYQEPWDVVAARRLYKRPLVTGGARWIHSQETWSAVLEGNGTGERIDSAGAAVNRLEGYFHINTAFTKKLSSDLNTSLRVANLLNQKPELGSDFYGEGLSALLSLEWKMKD